ncbi:hypothetical protein F2Q69_00044810 [Brassica cretica]|uniref:RING-type E3 ubiquitin transferase n=1 Tax=Brassica cretica TaxID=69181 RepID=A0A8S9NJK4_BRACR|nr:hypothetical protein F2Q69_00044810 [Brassica cretica]
MATAKTTATAAFSSIVGGVGSDSRKVSSFSHLQPSVAFPAKPTSFKSLKLKQSARLTRRLQHQPFVVRCEASSNGRCTLMRDPVILPSSKTTVDRAIIQRHLLSDNHDPFNRAHLTSDMLIPDIELKARIDEFVRTHQSKKRSSGEDSSNKERIQTTSSDMLID